MSTISRIEQLEFLAPPEVRVWQRKALAIGAALAIASIIGAVFSPAQAMHSYLIGFMMVLGLSLGSMGFLMVWHLTGGDWGVGIRRIQEAAAGCLPLVMLAFIPVLVGLPVNYKWARPEVLAQDEHIRQLASQYLNFWLVLIRGVLYFIAWGALAYYLRRWSSAEDRQPLQLARRYRGLAGAGLVIYFWTITFATTDWVMSAAAPWTSTIYAFIFAVGEGTIGLAFTIIVARALRRRSTSMSAVLRSKDFHDYGNFTLMFIMLWAWFNYSQWLLIWSGNLPDEIRFYLDRIRGGWGIVALAIIAGYFALPFCLLLSRAMKKDPNKLVWVAVWMFLMRYLDLYWNIAPNYSPEHFHFSWLDAVIPAALVALWIAYFFWNLERRPLVVLHDPHLHKLLEKQHE